MNPKHYSTAMKFIHWIMAFQIIALLAIGFYMSDMPWGESKKTLMMLHKSCGIMALFFIIARLITRFSTTTPEPRGNTIIQMIAKITSILLYGFMTSMAFSGFLMSDLGGNASSLFNLIELPHIFNKNVDLAKNFHLIHVYIGIPLAILIGLHFLGTLYHRFMLNDDVLSRMLPRICSKRKHLH
ncbi:MAG: cytochrome b [Pseudomonadota bacterium]